MPRGGHRPGAGRPRGSEYPVKAQVTISEEDKETALQLAREIPGRVTVSRGIRIALRLARESATA